jgi:hypothetical protein
MNPETIKDALVYFLAECNLPFLLVEHKSFRDLLHLLNRNTYSFGKTCISSHLAKVYIQTSEIIKMQCISTQKFLSFTEDAWTSPNVAAFMAVTVHFINDEFEMKDLTLSIPYVQDEHHSIKLWLCSDSHFPSLLLIITKVHIAGRNLPSSLMVS